MIGGWWTAKKIRENLNCSFQAVYDGLDAALRAGDIEERVVQERVNGRPFNVREFKLKEETICQNNKS